MIYLGSDHGGFELKEHIKQFLKNLEYEFKDLGNLKYDKGDDYPEYAFKVAEKASETPKNRGVLFCRSAAGMVIAANKVKGARAVTVFYDKSAVHSRQHNDANIIALSGDWMDNKKAEKILKAWLETEFSKEKRHVKRLKRISEYEK